MEINITKFVEEGDIERYISRKASEDVRMANNSLNCRHKFIHERNRKFFETYLISLGFGERVFELKFLTS